MLFFSNVTLALSVDIHICQGKVESLAFFGQKASCSKMMKAEMMEVPSCCRDIKNSTGTNVSQKSCCDNLQFFQENAVQKTSDDFNVQWNQSVITAEHHWPSDPIYMAEEVVITDANIPHPPILTRQNSQEILQVFQI